MDHDLQPQQLQVVGVLGSRGGNALRHATGHPEGGPRGCLDLQLPLGGPEPGEYDVVVRLEGPEGKELQVDHHRLVRAPESPPPKCVIDEHRRLLVDGKPFFPIGMYWSSINSHDLAVYAQSKFNCLMPYGSPTKQQMDLAQEHGLKVIYSIKDWYAGSAYGPQFIQSEADEEPQVCARVRQFREHPALLAWYLNDELPQQYLPRLETHQQWVAEEDPDHPTWVVLYQFREVAAYLKTFLMSSGTGSGVWLRKSTSGRPSCCRPSQCRRSRSLGPPPVGCTGWLASIVTDFTSSRSMTAMGKATSSSSCRQLPRQSECWEKIGRSNRRERRSMSWCLG